MEVDLNSSLTCLNISNLMARISTIDDTSEKIEKLNSYVKELNAEMVKIKESECNAPLCILVLTEAIQQLEKEILWYTNMKANAITQDLMPLRAGDSKGKGKEMLEKSSDADKRNWMSSIQLGSNNVAPHDNSSVLIPEDVAALDNQSPIDINSNKRKSAFGPYQRPSSGVIILGNSNISTNQHSSGGMFGISSVNMNFSGGVATQLTYHTPSLIDSSKKPRLSWTQDLHDIFVRVVNELGGPAAATPKQIRLKMMVNNLTNAEIKSHLQKYRLNIQEQYLASNPASVGPSTSRSSLTGQASRANMST